MGSLLLGGLLTVLSAVPVLASMEYREGMEPDDLLCSRNARPSPRRRSRLRLRLSTNRSDSRLFSPQPRPKPWPFGESRAAEDQSAPIPDRERAGLEGWEGSSQTILLARRTRTIRRCSFDARSEGQSGDSLSAKWGNLIGRPSEGETAGIVSVLAEAARSECAPSMRAVQ